MKVMSLIIEHLNEDLKFSGEQELVQFLSEEIAAECKAQKIKSIPSKIDDFDVKLNGSEVTLTKKTASETYVLNV
jgi:complement component 1 Q subcomponent-binding protein